MNKPALVWIRNDLRLHDNPALFEAISRCGQVLLVYIYDSSVLRYSCPGSASCVWLERALECFGKRVREKGFGWLIRKGSSLSVVRDLIRQYGCKHVFWNRRYEYVGIQQDGEIEEMLSLEGISVHTFQGNLLVEPWNLMTRKGTPFQVFTPYFEAFRESGLNLCEAPEIVPARWSRDSYSISPKALHLAPKSSGWSKSVLAHWEEGEEAALRALEAFCLKGLAQYEKQRDFFAIKGTSMLSPYLHFGEISPRRVWNMVLDYERKARRSIGASFLRELVWREFSYYILYHFPKTLQEPFKLDLAKISWRKEEKELRAWCSGNTGIPVVDAGMRQLWETGWMHNRVRMITASFLTKHLLHLWKEGMEWFWDTLFDGDCASNSYNWQNVAGCGAGAPPFFRIFNPVVQAQRFDPEGVFVKRFIPELKNVPPTYIHTPWEAPMKDLVSWGVNLGDNYPWPMVDIGSGRKRALEAYAQAKGVC